MSRFKHYPERPKRLTAAFAKTQYAKLLARLPAAEAAKTADQWLELFIDWNALKSYIGSEGSRISHTYCKDMNDRKAEMADKYFREKIALVIDEPEHTLTKAFLASRHRDTLAKRYGRQLIPVYKSALKPLDPINTLLSVKTGQLAVKYEKLYAKATVEINGKIMALPQAASLLSSPDEKLRKDVYLKTRGWVLKNHAKLSKIYKDLIKLRNQMGRNVGYKDFILLGYESMGRTDYGLKEVEKFRKNVRQYVVPLRKKLNAQKAKALGVKNLRPWDGYDPEHTLPIGIAPVDKQLDNAQKLFDSLSPVFGQHFKNMRRSKLIDLEGRKGKRTNPYCTSFSDEGKVEILCYSTGNASDVSTLVHEMGHAIQSLESRSIKAVDLQSGTADVCEIESMGMEFLVLPHINIFFDKENTAKFKFNRWEEVIYVLCYVCIVDEFQHWAYQNPGASADELDNKWGELNETYLPGTDYTGYEGYRATRWYLQVHVFSAPFYYIDYALAETGAIQLALLDRQDHQKVMDTYLKLCRLGGTKSFLSTFKAADLRSPFEPELMKEIMELAQEEMNI